ncbi:hypothetical protein AB0H03_17645 [Streptomyces sparsogenes]|uniref:hypothetical protein n=1 Tax=Streptomyces sparsogenes TaxID=67365 RepID=UPI0033F032DC
MQGNGADQQRGHVLLIAGDRAVHRRTVQVLPSSNLAALAAVPTPVLLGTDIPADLVHLDGVTDQNSLLLRLRTATATPGPLLMYLSGRLTADRRANEIYLALASTTSSNTRYTALPWTWVRTELRSRPPGTSTLLIDLAADKHAWPQLQNNGTALAAGLEVYGVVSPPGFPGTAAPSPYTRNLIEQLRRNPQRPSNARLHALTIAAADLAPGTLVLPSAPQIAPTTHDEQAARPPRTNLQRLLAGEAIPLPRRRLEERSEPAPGLNRRPLAPVEQRPSIPQPPQQTTADRAPAPREAQADHQQRESTQQHSVRAPHPPEPAPQPDPRPIIWQTAQAGRHNEAAEMAAAWEQHVLQTYGFDSPQATQWAEIRADLARMAGRWTLATQLWIAAARTRLAHQPPDAPEVLNAAKAAHYCWTQIKDQSQARSCGPELVNLLRQMPALDPRHLSTAQQRLGSLQEKPTSR